MGLKPNTQSKIDGVSLASIAERFGTPTYVYSQQTIAKNIEAVKTAFKQIPLRLHYAVKANSHLSILKSIRSLGVGADVVSLGELERALAARWKPSEILFSGVGKSLTELKRAYELDLEAVQLESLEEIDDAASVARGDHAMRIGLRINPDIDAKTHPKIATGLYDTKFGIAASDLDRALERIARYQRLKLVGIGCHLGSQITDPSTYREAKRQMIDAIRTRGMESELEYLNLGGGFAYDYHASKHVPFTDYARAIAADRCSLPIALELGRSLIVDAGTLVTRVIRTKATPRKKFVIVDASMTELIRPALYDAFHRIEEVDGGSGPEWECDVVGPVCETSDLLGASRTLTVKTGDLVVIRDVGAYGASMASNYNLRPRPTEVWITSNGIEEISPREPLESLR